MALHISGTRIRLFRDCARKWAFQYIPHGPDNTTVKLPSTASQQLGTDMHTVAELYLRDGVQGEGKLWEMFSSGIDQWPNTPYETEVPFEYPIAGGTMTGVIDVLDRENKLVGDHKTTKTFYWAKTKADLLSDPQAQTYAIAAAHLMGLGPDEPVNCQWTYYKTSKTQRKFYEAKSVKFKFDGATRQRAFKKLETSAKKMLALYDEKVHPLDCQPNWDHCGAYGGCAFQAECEKHGETTVSNLSKLDAVANDDPAPATHSGALNLYVDCEPLNGSYQTLLEFLAPEITQLCDSMDLDHWTLADYGKSPGLLCALLSERDDLSGEVVIRSNTPEAYAVLSFLRARATRVIQGVR